jgi:hypothetical protein
MDGITRKCTKMRLPYRWARYFGYKKGWRGIGIVKRSMCKYPNAQFTSTGNGPPISSTGPLPEVSNPISSTAFTVRFFCFLAQARIQRV